MLSAQAKTSCALTRTMLLSLSPLSLSLDISSNNIILIMLYAKANHMVWIVSEEDNAGKRTN